MRIRRIEKKASFEWSYIVYLIIGLVVLGIILYSGIGKQIPVIREILYWFQSVF